MSIRGPAPADMALYADAMKLEALLPQLEAEVDRLVNIVHIRMATAIQDGTLTGEKAQNAWHEINAYRRILKILKSRISAGKGAGEAAAPHMQIGDEDA